VVLRVALVQRLLQRGQILGLFFLDVLAQISPEGLERGLELGVLGGEALEFVEVFFDLFLINTNTHVQMKRGKRGGRGHTV
jgi:hypothetical protein